MDVDSMTPEQVRREIAERRGVEVHYHADKDLYGVYYNAYNWHAETPDAALTRAGVPDWPNDAGAALALCLEIAQFEYTLHLYHSRHADGHTLVSADFYGWDDNTDEQVDAFVATGDAPALALARLALLALRDTGA